MLFSYTSALLLSSVILDGVSAFGRFGSRPRQHLARQEFHAASVQKKDLESRDAAFRFLNNQTQPYFVESLPDVTFNISEMYSGSIPIDENDPSRTLFFVFHPTTGAPVDEITIWLNGGPGCSSLEGFFQENGPYVWRPGTFAPTRNPYAWTNLTNMIWVEQPVGTGFAQGTPTATTQEETAQDFIKFFKSFEQLFGIKNFKVYVTGESYAGRYVPYIAAAMLDQNDTTYYNVSGAMVFDPCIGEFNGIQEEYTAVPYVQANANLFNFDDDFMAQLDGLHQSCGFADYIDKYLVFPPSAVQPPSFFNFSDDAQANCDVFDMINSQALETNPCFDIYEVNLQCPLQWDVLGFPTELVYVPEGANVYFDRTDVKKAIHAPLNVTWAECSVNPVYVGNNTGPEAEGDTSPDPIQKVLPQVIEATNRVIVSNGDFDMIIITNGTLLSIQNMTWNGQLGFQSAPNTPINITMPDIEYAAVFDANGADGVDGPQGIMGRQHFERGLMWAETFQSGHMQPQYQPRVTYRYMQWLLGHVDTL